MESARATGGGAPGRLPAPGPLAGASRRTDVSAVPADVNLALLGHLTAEPELNLVVYCIELSAGFAADGYSRASHLHRWRGRLLGRQPHPSSASWEGTTPTTMAPAASSSIPSASPRSPSWFPISKSKSVDLAVKPLLVAGLKLRVAKAQQAFMELADACEYLIAIIASAKGMDVLSGETNVITEPGDSWFKCQRLCLPEKCGYGFQMQYGSIGWSVGATLKYSEAVKERPALARIGDNSRCIDYDPAGQRSIVFIINNGGYTITVEIHDRPSNVIKNQNYTGVVGAINSGEGKCCNSNICDNNC
ncbi:Pyruvate decarboxylase [Musa troglodytarum]|uniref:pyruvate decarboxylase n=1 Tax=Musa troglodytarum TaxID=320322 RepID=A0A9E7GSI0_9LILI|nr:Pyruvate decarboxylase [Musa troglodytarum]